MYLIPSMPKKLTTKEFIERASALHNYKYDYSKTEYINSVTKVIIICPEHGEFLQRPNRHLAGDGCPTCGALTAAQKCTHSAEQFIQKAKEIHGEAYDYSKVVYKGSKVPVTLVCPIHGEFNIKPNHHTISKVGCPQCAVLRRSKLRNKSAKAEFIPAVTKIHKNKYDYSKVNYVDAITPVIIICPEHGEFLQTPVAHKQGCGCPVCGIARNTELRTKTFEAFVEAAHAVHNNRYTYDKSTYVNSKTKTRIICPEHGEFWQTPNSHTMGQGCPVCGARGVSNAERRLQTDLEQLCPGLTLERNVRKLLSNPRHEIDLYCPIQKVGIEYNGNYWHSEPRKTKFEHQNKVLDAEQHGVHLIHVNEYLWKHRPSQVLNMLRAKLTVLPHKVYARQTFVKEVDSKTSREFCERNHVQGAANAAVHLGLYHNNKLVALFTAGTPRFNKNYNWEIIRMASEADIRVIGGFGKLWKHFLKTYVKEGESVCSYAQLDWSLGNVYKTLGFDLIGNTEPGYTWVNDKGDHIPRYKTQKKKLQNLIGDAYDPTKSETENLHALGWTRMWNAGTRLFAFKKH